MITALYAAGIIIIIVGIILGINTGTFWGFIIFTLSLLISSIVYFALARILENQSDIYDKIQSLVENTKKTVEKLVCSECGKNYDSDFSSCPYCGNKTQDIK